MDMAHFDQPLRELDRVVLQDAAPRVQDGVRAMKLTFRICSMSLVFDSNCIAPSVPSTMYGDISCKVVFARSKAPQYARMTAY
jgi:hypothetical protein